MLEPFYRAIWYPISVYLFEIVAIPCMSMFPLRPRSNAWWQKVLWIVLGIACACVLRYGLVQLRTVLTQLLGISGSYYQSMLTHLVAMVAVCAVLYRGSFFSKTLTVILALSLAGQIGFVYGNLMLLWWKPEFTPGMIMVRDVLGYGTFAMYYLVLGRYSNVTTFYLTLRDHLLLIVISFLNFTLGCVVLRYLDGMTAQLLFNLTCVFATVAITFLLFRFTNEHQRAVDQQIALQDMRMSQSALVQMQETAAQMKELRHELSNHFTYLDTLVEEQRYDELHAYLRRAEDQSREAAQTITTANPVVNSIVNQKLSYARSLGILTQAKVILPDTLPLEDLTLCSLLGNLLNNAIEACRGQEAPVIDLRISPVKTYLIFQVENSVTRDVLKDNPNLTSTKVEAENHGIGLRVIRRITNKHNGILRYEMSAPDRFVMRVMLPI